jgi:hypothetical protein
MTSLPAYEAAREHLRTSVRQILDEHLVSGISSDEAELRIMNAAQDWVIRGYVIGSQPESSPCTGNALGINTVHRSYAPNGWEGIDPADTPDPGPFTVGEHVTCRYCGREAEVVKVKTHERETLTQYVGWLGEH